MSLYWSVNMLRSLSIFFEVGLGSTRTRHKGNVETGNKAETIFAWWKFTLGSGWSI
jgi:hypothetical protein